MAQWDTGSRVGERYTIERPLGVGGSARTFAAIDAASGRRVTLKVARTRERGAALAEEMALLAALYHPNLVRPVDLFEESGRVVLACEWVEGAELAGGAGNVEALARDVASALAFLHAVGVVHGDVKPENVIVHGDRATLIDLGAARLGAGDARAYTPEYAAPETRERGEVTSASDVYGLARAFVGRGSARLDGLLAPLLSSRPAERPDAAAIAARLGASVSDLSVARLRSRFVGRRDELERVVALASERGGRALVVGPRGVGKTRLGREAAWRVAVRARVCAPDVGEPLVDALARALGAPAGASVSALLDAAEQRTAPLLLLVDGLDVLGGADVQVVRALLARGDLPIGVVATALQAPPDWRGAVVSLGPLDARAVDLMVEGTPIGRASVRACDGNPAAIVALARGASSSPSPAAPRPLGDARVLALLAASPSPLSAAAIADLAGDEPAIERLVASGEAEAVAAGGFALALGAAVDPAHVRAAHATLLARATAPEARLRHAAGAGDEAAVRAAIAELGVGVRASPSREHARLARELATSPSPAAALFAAEVLERAGDAKGATAALARAVRRGAGEGRAHAWLVLGRIYLRRNSPRALRALARSALDAARVDETIALMRLGRFTEAERAADAALGRGVEADTRVDLLVSRALARSFGGDLASPAADLAGLAEPSSPRRRFRLHNARATVALRAGRIDEAVRSYSRALGETRRGALDDLELSATVNLAVARHQAGDHGRALSGYARARDLARGAGSSRTETLLALYRARLFADLEAWDRAELELSFAPPDALGPIERASRTHVLGEIALARGRPEEAATLGRAAADACDGAPRERAEALTLVLAAHVARGDAALARGLADELRDDASALGADDVLARVELAWSECLAAAGSADEALACAKDALGAAERAKRPRLVRSAHALLGRVLLGAGAALAAAPHLDAAKRLDEEIRTALPADLRGPAPASPAAAAASQVPVELPRRLLRVFGATSENDAYARVVDEAIAETRAERGFLLRRGAGDDLHVAAAKNVDHGAIKRPRQKYGRSIAARVIETGEAVALADARASDSRPTATAHRLGLRSVLCVPVFAEGRVEGALYLDNRFTPGAFSPDDERTVRLLLEGLSLAVARHRAEGRLTRELARRSEAAPASPVDLGEVAGPISSPFPEIATRSHAMATALETARRVADVDVPVLVRGESGTGKELVARAIHEHGARRGGPFVAVNCGALPEALLEAELFGYVRGAFTGAVHDKAGLFVAAQGGTLFLDELGEMPLAMQVKLLRALQEREVRPLGSTRSVPVDARIVSATHKDLRAQIEAGDFREDLYYRVAVVDLTLPPLRERIEDVPALAELFVERLRQRSGTDRRLSTAAMGQLVRHAWPGNVRELESALARAFYLGDGPEILEVPGLASPGRARRKDEREVLAAALAREGWNVRKVAQMLGIPRATFYRRLARYGLERAPR